MRKVKIGVMDNRTRLHSTQQHSSMTNQNGSASSP